MAHPTVIDKYQILAPLGNGHFGQVYHAFDRALQAEKAIKVLNVTDPSQFLDSLKEAQILKLCNHKHIVAINEANVFPVNGTPRVILDLEYVAQGSLEGAMASRWVSIRDAVTYLQAHSLVCSTRTPKGFFTATSSPATSYLHPRPPSFPTLDSRLSPVPLPTVRPRDTPHLPPEFFSKGTTSVESDVYAAGVTLFRAASNLANWRSILSATSDVQLHVEKGTLLQAVGFQPYVPAKIAKIIRKACSPDPKKRFQSAHEFCQQLDRLRFDIDWIRVTDLLWSGNNGTHSFELFVDPTSYALTVKRNGRRQTQKCKSYPSLSGALGGLHSFVASTTLQQK